MRKTGLAMAGFEDGRGLGAKELGVASRSWQRQGFSPRASRKECHPADTLTSAQ